MAKDAYYFSHDSNAKDDPKCMLLIEELQLEGYGIYWLLVEVLREQENYKYPLRMVPVLARKFLTTKEKMLAVIYKYDLFVVENEEFFYSESLNRRMGLMNDKREQARLAGKKSGEARRNKALEYKKEINTTSTDVQQTFNDSSTDAEQLKESKVKESKLNKKENKEDINQEVFNYYVSKTNLTKHKNLVEPMKKGIALAIKTYDLDLDYLKKIIDRHSEKIEQTKNSEFPVSQRTLQELFGQKKYKSQDLICADYLDEKYISNKKLTVEEIKQQSDKESAEKYGF